MRNAGNAEAGAREKKKTDKNAEGSSGTECRCEEVSRKTLPELIKMMLKDLAFWKRKR